MPPLSSPGSSEGEALMPPLSSPGSSEGEALLRPLSSVAAGDALAATRPMLSVRVTCSRARATPPKRRAPAATTMNVVVRFRLIICSYLCVSACRWLGVCRRVVRCVSADQNNGFQRSRAPRAPVPNRPGPWSERRPGPRSDPGWSGPDAYRPSLAQCRHGRPTPGPASSRRRTRLVRLRPDRVGRTRQSSRRGLRRAGRHACLVSVGCMEVRQSLGVRRGSSRRRRRTGTAVGRR